MTPSVPRKLISIGILYQITTVLMYVGTIMYHVTHTIAHTSDNKPHTDNSYTLRILLIYADIERSRYVNLKYINLKFKYIVFFSKSFAYTELLTLRQYPVYNADLVCVVNVITTKHLQL